MNGLMMVDTLVDDFKMLQGMKAWVRYGFGAPKPDNWKAL
jgi:hypothetical protein